MVGPSATSYLINRAQYNIVARIFFCVMRGVSEAQRKMKELPPRKHRCLWSV
jgi:hypothetical protein